MTVVLIIAEQYRLYEKLRKQKSRPKEHERKVSHQKVSANNLTTPRKERPEESQRTLKEDIDFKEEGGELLQRDLGPTPQLKGRLLGLFDGLAGQREEHITPTKTTTVIHNESPTKRPPLETPDFLRTKAIAQHAFTEVKAVKSVSRLMYEYRCMQTKDIDAGESVMRELELNECIEDTMHNQATASDDENSQDNSQPGSPNKRYKKVGLKRSHRRVRSKLTIKLTAFSATASQDASGGV